MHIILNVINEILEFKYETYENEKQKTKTVVNRDTLSDVHVWTLNVHHNG